MISITTSFISTAKMTDRSVVSACSLGLSRSAAAVLRGTGLSSFKGGLESLVGLPVQELGNERPTKAPEAAAVKAAQAQAYAFAATGAGFKKQTTQHHKMWAFRGLEPWSDPA
ncbi:hypothetical protein [Streptomyces sp. NPDC050504]|uniref:hypothetical protein n=1 Tax=Streptomyces sp. NPDC050504 TaxID=3365618 RepID=UPI0037A71BD4